MISIDVCVALTPDIGSRAMWPSVRIADGGEADEGVSDQSCTDSVRASNMV